MTRVDPAPKLDASYDLDPSCVDEFRAKGHTVVRGLASADEVASYRPAIHAAANEHAHDKRPNHSNPLNENPPLTAREAFAPGDS